MIQRVLAPNPGPMTLTGTNTYVLTDGRGAVGVIDPGPDDPAHLQAILAAAAPLGPVVRVLVTHRHADHLPAAAPLCQRTGARLVGHAALPGVQQPVGDLEPAFGSLVALFTPGHTRESLCFWDPDERALFTGDLIAGQGTVVLDDQPGALADYLASLERLRELGPLTIYPGHGPAVADGAEKIREYLDHRRARVAQVVAALRGSGPSTIEDLVGIIYPDVAPNLAPMAARNVRANLELLRGEGRVEATGEQWQLTPVRP